MRYYKVLFLFIGILLFTVSCGSNGGDDNGGGDNGGVVNSTISGTVLDASGAPINAAQVTISSTPVTVTTDANGKFSALVETGTHTIVIQMGATKIYNSTFTCNGPTCNLGNVAAAYCTFSGWSKYLGNPVFASGGAGTWDHPIFAGAVLKDNNAPIDKYKRWYLGGITAAGEGMSIGYAISSDGINWVKDNNNPVMTHGNTWDNNGIETIAVIKDGSMYKMWYEGESIGVENTIGYATSFDGLNWTPYPSNPVFTVAWDNKGTKEPSVIKDDSTYKMWYSSQSSSGSIGLATSTDGISWHEVGSGPVMIPDLPWENGEGIGTPKVIKNQSGYTMVYNGNDQLDIARIGIATSIDGISWIKDSNPILDVGTGNDWDSVSVGPEALIEDGSILKMWYIGVDNSGNRAVGLAVSCQ